MHSSRSQDYLQSDSSEWERLKNTHPCNTARKLSHRPLFGTVKRLGGLLGYRLLKPPSGKATS